MNSPAPIVRRMLWVLGGLALVVAFGWVVARTGPLAPIRVTVAKVEGGQVAPDLFGIGAVEARRAYLIGPTVAGRVLRVAVDVGEPVRAGQLLAEMDPVDLAERATSLAASARRAEAAVAAAQAQLADAQARESLAAINARRYRELGASHFVSASAVEAKVQELASAQAGRNAAQANLDGARQELLRLLADGASLAQQRANLRLVAPTDGMVSAREAEPGSTVVAGQAVLRMIQPASLWVRVRIDQGRSRGLAVGLPARIVLRSNPAEALPGQVVRVEPVSDSITEERVALVAFDAIPPEVAVGELAEVTLAVPPSPSGPVLPNASLRQRGSQAGVWVRQDTGALRFVPVRVGRQGPEGRVLVAGALVNGDEVIVHSEGEIQSDSRVQVVDAVVEGFR